MSDLSLRTQQLIEHLIKSDARLAVGEKLTRECSAEAVGCARWTREEMERIHFAILKLGAKADYTFDSAILLAKTDWRDLLMAASFGEDLEAHNKWWHSNVS